MSALALLPMRMTSMSAVPSAGPLSVEFQSSAQSLGPRPGREERSAFGKFLPVPGSPAGAGFELFERTGANRAVAEQFIHRRFAESFGARVEAFMPRLLGMYDQNGKICGALGLRSANHRLFVEHYLDHPIEKAIALRAGVPVERSSIVEVGHLSGTFPGAMRTLIWLLIERLYHEGFHWVAFTGTTGLRNAFRRIGLFPLDIHVAAAESIPEDARAAWGNYYDHAPRVFVGRIEDGVHRLMHIAAHSMPDFGRPA